MDTSDIAIIRTISETGSLTRAAEQLFVSQPTLSKKLARLEAQLDSTLFNRSPTGLVATAVAEYIIAKAQPLNDQLARIERHVEQLSKLHTGVVRLGVGPIIEQVLLPDVLRKFVDRTGDVRISVQTDEADSLIDQFHQAKLDLIAGPFDAQDFNDKDHIAFALIGDPIIQVARSGHPIFASTASHSVDEQKQEAESYPLAAPKVQGAVTQTSKASKTGRHRKSIVCDNYALLKDLTLNTDCICAGPERLFHEELKRNLLKRVPETYPVLTWQSACISRPESLSIPLVKLLLDIFTEVNQVHNSTELT